LASLTCAIDPPLAAPSGAPHPLFEPPMLGGRQ